MHSTKSKKTLATATLALMLSLTYTNLGYAADSDKTIPYPTTYNTHIAGASPYIGTMDIPQSPYYPQLDFYNMKSNDHLTILSNYKTYQQSNDITCGPAAALTVLYHFGNTEYSELWLAGQMNTKAKTGTLPEGIVNFFDSIGWQTESSLTTKPFSTIDQFKTFTLQHLNNNTPIMVENIEWAGHWRVIIGYDTMGTASLGDDVLIMVDPFDTSDHLQDGYTIVSADRFFETWFDTKYFPKQQSYQPWVVAHPK